MPSPPVVLQRMVPANKYIALVAAVILAAGALQVAHALPVQLTGWLCESSGSLFSSGSLSDLIKAYGYLSLFLLMTFESASAPIPSEVVLPVAGVLASQGVLSLPLALIVSTAAALAGALIDYYLARFLGRPFVLRLLRLFRLDSRDLEKAEGWFDRSGQWTVFAARFVPLVRALISLPAGLFRMSLKSFIFMTVVGCTIWNGVLLYAGFTAGGYIGNACAETGAAALADSLAIAAAGIAVVYLVYFGLSRRSVSGGGAVTPAASGF